MNQQRGEPVAQEGAHRLSVVHFLIALVLLLVLAPFVDQLEYGELIDSVLITVVFWSAVMAVGGRRRTLIAAALLATPAVLAKWIDHFRPDAIPDEFVFVTAIVFTGFVVGHLLAFVLRAPQVTDEVVCAGISVFLMTGFLWAFAYELVALLAPHSFVFTVGQDANRPITALDALFFSFGALTNYYGEIVPMSNSAQTLATIEATAGVFYMAVLISRLVSLYPGNQPMETASAQNPSPEIRRASPDRIGE